MRFVLSVVILTVFIFPMDFSRIVIRHKREIERESTVPNESTVVVSGDPESNDFDNYEPYKPNTDVMEVDFDKEDGTFSFGGKFPAFSTNFHMAMNNLFREMTRRFEDMAKNMGERFNNASSEYPANYNGTKEDIVTIDGKQYIKKVHVVKKSNNNTLVFLSSTTYEPVDKSENES
jgi:hypothetical protein